MSIRGTRHRAGVAVVCLAIAHLSGQAQTPAPEHRDGRFRVSDLYGDVAAADAAAHGVGSSYLRYAHNGEIDILAVTAMGRGDALSAWLAQVGGHVAFREDAIGYLRASVPVARWREASALPGVEAVGIDGLRIPTGDWTEMPGLFNIARMVRDGRSRPQVTRSSAPTEALPDPKPTVDDTWIAQEIARRDGLFGLDRLRQEHPTFDGRGVTVAIYEESALRLAWGHPALQAALSLDGQPVAKIRDVEASGFWGRVNAQAAIASTERSAYVNGIPFQLPGPGAFRLGHLELDHRTYAVLWQPSSRRTWLDHDNDYAFAQDEMLEDPLGPAGPSAFSASMSKRIGAGSGKQLVATHIDDGAAVLLLPFGVWHPTMAAGIVAGSSTSTLVGTGLAPGARLMLGEPLGTQAHNFLEGLIRLARRGDVDIINMSTTGVSVVPPDPQAVSALVVDRLATVYNTLVIIGAGNAYADEAAHAWTSGISVGALLDASTARRYHGVATADGVWPYSQRGPSLVGAIKPDVLGLSGQVGIAPCDRQESPGKHVIVPPCYGITSGTSAATPSIAGLAAVLASGARQKRISFTALDLRRAIVESGRMLPGVSAAEQGRGVPQADVAWRILARPESPPRIVSRGQLAHALQAYVPVENRRALYEREGWTPGKHGRRAIALRRETGSKAPQQFRLEWQANDGTFRAPAEVVLPYNEWVDVPIDIRAGSSGPKNALLVLRTMQGASAHSQPIGIVSADEFAAPTFAREYAGELTPLTRIDRAFRVPRGVAGIRVTLELSSPTTVVLGEPAGWTYRRYPVEKAWAVQPLPSGRHEFVLPDPDEGVWMLSLAPESGPSTKVSYRVRLTAYGVALSERGGAAGLGERKLTVKNVFAPTTDVKAWAQEARRYERRASFGSSGEPLTFDVPIPKDTPFLELRARTVGEDGSLQMYAYDCTNDCFRYDALLPARREAATRIDRPSAGLWRLVVTPGPGTRYNEDVVVEWTVGGAQQQGARPIELPRSLTTAQSATTTFLWHPKSRQDGSDSVVVTRVDLGLEATSPQEAGSVNAVHNRLVPVGTGLTFIAPRSLSQGARLQ